MLLLLFLLHLLHKGLSQRLTESERVQQWYAKGNTWPPTWNNETEGYKRMMAHREYEIMDEIYGGDERWENWMQQTQSRLVPNFTRYGFEIVQTPCEIHTKLRNAVTEGLANWETLPEEGNIDVIYHSADNVPKFIHIGGLQQEILEALKPMHEKWTGGIQLKPSSAYGVRLYRNGSSLVMHNDRVETHVISCIAHIAHEYDDDNHPWPIQIEDHDGNLHSVSLEEGQMLHYESAKCLHGRMDAFRGKYYGSIFVHYQPVDKKTWNYTVDSVINAVPPHWSDGIDRSEGRGSRWCGAAMSVSSRVAKGAPPLTRHGKILQETLPHNYPPILPPPAFYPGEIPEVEL